MIYRLCIDCKKIYRINITYRFILAVVLIAISFPGVFVVIPRFLDILKDPYSYLPNIVIFFVSYVVLIVGILMLSGIYNKERDCNICNGKKTLIKLDTPKAVEIIKKHDVSFPLESSEEKEFFWETK